MDESTNTPATGTEDWLLDLRDVAVEVRVPTVSAVVPTPPLDRERPNRRPIVAGWVWIAAGAGLLVCALVVGSAFLVRSRTGVVVPGVVGLQTGVARITLQRVGLELEVSEERFDQSPKGSVLSQTPQAGTKLERGEPVMVVVSAGTEEIVMPDVVGDGLALATGSLAGFGLSIQVEYVLSDDASDTVLSTIPAAGVRLRTGDTVRLTVASRRQDSTQLRPFRMDGVTVIIDPAPLPRPMDRDIVIEISRRLEALLEASGATTVLLRSALDTASPDTARADRAADASGTVGIGLTMTRYGESGRSVSIPPSSTPNIGTHASRLGAEIIAGLEGVATPVQRTESSFDPILTRAEVPWARVTVGSADSRDDELLFRDPRWADAVARALYRALGEVYGQAVSP